MITQDNPVSGQPGSLEPRGFAVSEQQGFTTEDILWSVGIWSIVLCLSPMIVFYMLMVA